MRLPSALSTSTSTSTSRSIVVALFVCCCAGFADSALIPFFALWAQDSGIPTARIGLLLACYSGGELLATPFLGGLADRIGRRPVLLLSCAGVGVGFLLLYCVRGALPAALALLTIGIFESVLHPTMYAVLADSAADGQRRRHFSLARVMSHIGRIAGPAVAALLALRSLSTVFAGCGVAMLAGALAVAAWLPETRPALAAPQRHADNDGKGNDNDDGNGNDGDGDGNGNGNGEGDDDDGDDDSLAGILPVFRDARLAGLLCCMMVIEISAGWIDCVLPLQAHDTGTLTASATGWLFTYGAALVVLFQLPVSTLAERLGSRRTIVAAGLMLAAAFGVLLASHGVAALAGGVTLLALAHMLFGPLVISTIGDLAPADRRASYMAAASVANDLQDTAGPALGTLLYAWSARLPWLAGMPLALGASAVLALRLRRAGQHGAGPDDARLDDKEPAQPRPRIRYVSLR